MRKLKHGDVYTFYSARNNVYGAFQILKKVPNWSGDPEPTFMCVMLDYSSINKPDLCDFENSAVLLENRPRFTRYGIVEVVFYITENNTINSDYCYLGNLPDLFSDNCNSITSIDSVKIKFDSIYEYSLLEDSVKDRIRECVINPQKVEINGNIYNTDEGTLKEDMLDLNYIDNFYAGHTIFLKNSIENITNYISRLPIISDLVIENNELEVLDLRNTNLSSIKIDASNLVKLYIDNTTINLELTGRINSNLQIIQDLRGKDLNLLVSHNFTTNFGLCNLSRLRLSNFKNFDFSLIIENFKNLQVLNINDINRLTNFDVNYMMNLRIISMNNVYNLDGNFTFTNKNISCLENIYLQSVSKNFGDVIKKEFKETEIDCTVKLLRSEEWVKNNTDNPFASWLDSEYIPSKVSKKAVSTYKKFRKEILKEFKLQENLDKKIEMIAIDYITVFNNLESEKFVIETIEREEICDAFMVILMDANKLYNCDINFDSINKIIDQTRNW